MEMVVAANSCWEAIIRGQWQALQQLRVMVPPLLLEAEGEGR